MIPAADKPWRGALKPRRRFTWRELRRFFPRFETKWR